MMEKYAVDLKAIPPTDDQIRTIRRLDEGMRKEAGVKSKPVELPKTSEEAEYLIKQLEAEYNE